MTQQVLLCGGPDRCGKTTILAELSRRTGIPVFRPSNLHDTFLSAQERFIQELRHADFRMVDMLAQLKCSVLVDRTYMCESVYSKVYGRRTDVDALVRLDGLFARLGAGVLVCTRRSFNGIQDDLDPKKLDSAALKRISRLYVGFSRWSKCPVHFLYVDDEDLDRQVNDVLGFMERLKQSGSRP
jgi:hypothetical protein